jgi:hypothetical protein
VLLPFRPPHPPPKQALDWDSPELESFVFEVGRAVRDADALARALRDRLARAEAALRAWQAEPMFSRKDGKVSSSTPGGRMLLLCHVLLLCHGLCSWYAMLCFMC